MKATLIALLSLTLLACGGASASVADALADPPTASPDAPKTFVSSAEDSSAPARDASADAPVQPTQDAGGQDSSTEPDASADAAPEGGQDSGPIEPPRFGVRFDGLLDQRATAPFPAGVAGSPSVTFEGYFELHQLGSNGRLFHTSGAYCAVATTGAEIGRVACCPLASGLGCVYSAGAAPTGRYFHLAYVLSAGAWTLFVDGAPQAAAASPYAAYPAPTPGAYGLLLGARGGEEAPRLTVDELRVSATARYAGAFAPPKHLDPDAGSKLALLLDEGAGASSGPMTLSGATWQAVAR